MNKVKVMMAGRLYLPLLEMMKFQDNEWLHQSQANTLSDLGVLDKFIMKRIFLSAYNSIPGGFGRVKPEANQAIIDQLNEGTLFIKLCWSRIFPGMGT